MPSLFVSHASEDKKAFVRRNQPVSTVVEFTCRMRYRRFDGDATGVLISSV